MILVISILALVAIACLWANDQSQKGKQQHRSMFTQWEHEEIWRKVQHARFKRRSSNGRFYRWIK